MKFILFLLSAFSALFQTALYAKSTSLEIWISSFQDQVYYEQMGELFAKKTKKELSINVKAYGFREMPDKLGVAVRSGQGIPDIVQLDETFFGVFLNDDSPFLDLTQKIKKSGILIYLLYVDCP